ncbi:hypothetical protein AMTR_s00126p00119860 [Amborella trichopoda]|uniref:Uncharacterized protein n=1 Tax=Amborella trichopoda TaxID=13333 RepID=W1NMP9_AMBTC|nr:hypothetical protein AMTR_s00126p00119860 [Amborella trichopoda]
MAVSMIREKIQRHRTSDWSFLSHDPFSLDHLCPREVGGDRYSCTILVKFLDRLRAGDDGFLPLLYILSSI